MLPAVKFSVAVSVAIGLSVFACIAPAVAQEATKSDAASAAATKPSDASSDHRRSRAERRAEAAKTDTNSDAKSQTLAQFPKADGAKAAKAEPEKPKLECRKQEILGSRVGKNICATPEQWAQADEQAAEAVRQMRSESGSKAGQAALSGPFQSGGRP